MVGTGNALSFLACSGQPYSWELVCIGYDFSGNLEKPPPQRLTAVARLHGYLHTSPLSSYC